MAETLSREKRHQFAREAWQVLPHGGRDSARLHVQCGRSHHVAVVYDTDAGLVYSAPVRPHSHGQRDLPDTMHGTAEPEQWFDLLDVADDDELPAWCDCGHRSLSRATVLDWVAAGEHRVVID
jgi:hypothetical protein